jgi:integrase
MRDGRVFLWYEPSEVKNRRPLEFELPGAVATMLDEHVASPSPFLCPEGTPWLFPRRDGTAPMDASRLSARISHRIRKATGLEVHAHLFRHLAARIWLRANPGHYESLRRILGHSQLSTTVDVYAGFEASVATLRCAQLISKVQGGRA